MGGTVVIARIVWRDMLLLWNTLTVICKMIKNQRKKKLC